MACPRECEEDRVRIRTDVAKLWNISISPILRNLIISAIGFLFVLFGGLYLYANASYATKESVSQMRVEQKEERREILDEIRLLRQDLKGRTP